MNQNEAILSNFNEILRCTEIKGAKILVGLQKLKGEELLDFSGA